MPFFLRAKRLDLSAGKDRRIVVLREEEGETLGILPGDRVEVTWRGGPRLVATANYTHESVKRGQVGVFREVWKGKHLEDGEPISLTHLDRPASIVAIRKKLLGHRLNETEIREIVEDIVADRLGTAEMTYFVASGFVRPYSDDELYWLTKAIAETGATVRFPGPVVDKHSIGGLTGNRTTMIAVPIVASLGLTIPKTSSRAITSASGTADTMEVLAPVSFPLEQIVGIVRKTNGCLVWGGSLNLAPADDKIIRVSYPLSLEPYSKMVVSILAKKVAMGVTHLVIDLPYGPTAKIHHLPTARRVAGQFVRLGKRFGMSVKVVILEAREPIGRGVGPALEARDVLRVLQQKAWRPVDLEMKSIRLAGELLELCGEARRGRGAATARRQLTSGAAWKTMQEIIRSQSGNPRVDAEGILTAALRYRVHSPRAGRVTAVNTKAIDELCRILGAPHEKLAGIFVDRRLGGRVRRGERLFTMYARQRDRLELARAALDRMRVFTLGR